MFTFRKLERHFGICKKPVSHVNIYWSKLFTLPTLIYIEQPCMAFESLRFQL